MVLKFCKWSAKECKKRVLECKKCPMHLNTKKQPQSCCLFDFLLNFLCLNVPETYYLKFCKISAKECKKRVVECKKRPVHLNTKKQPQSCCLFDFLLKFFCLNVPETYYLRNGQNYILINKKDNDFFIVLFIWAAVDSNHRPHPYQGCALTT